MLIIEINIPKRSINLKIEESVLQERLEKMKAKGNLAFKPGDRPRAVSKALQAYALMASSAAKGGVRDLSSLIKLSE